MLPISLIRYSPAARNGLFGYKVEDPRYIVRDIVHLSMLDTLISRRSSVCRGREGYPRVETLVGKERSDSRGAGNGVIICELSYRKESDLIILYIRAVCPQVTLDVLIGPFRLTISFGMERSR